MTAVISRKGCERPDLGRAFAHIVAGQKVPDQPDADPIATLREFVDRYGDVAPRPPLSNVEVRPVSAAGVAAEWIIPSPVFNAARLVYFHGGGWVAGGLESHRSMAAALADCSGSAVLLVDYRLAPEYPFPAGLDDCSTALAWAANFGPDGEGSAERLYLIGDSAGGNLAVGACRRTLLAGGRVPDRMALLSAVLDCSANPARGDAIHMDADEAGLEAIVKLYLQGRTVRDDPDVSPLCAGHEFFVGMPPTLLQVSGAEYLLWDSAEFARRLVATGVRAVLSVWPDMPHVWHAFLTLLPEARQAMREIADFLHQADSAVAGGPPNTSIRGGL